MSYGKFRTIQAVTNTWTFCFCGNSAVVSGWWVKAGKESGSTEFAAITFKPDPQKEDCLFLGTLKFNTINWDILVGSTGVFNGTPEKETKLPMFVGIPTHCHVRTSKGTGKWVFLVGGIVWVCLISWIKESKLFSITFKLEALSVWHRPPV